jgi:hypothetical protein
MKYHAYADNLRMFIERNIQKSLIKQFTTGNFMQPNYRVNKFKVIYQKDTNSEAYNEVNLRFKGIKSNHM